MVSSVQMLRWRQFQLWHNCLSNFIATSESLRAETIAGCCQQVLCLGHELKVKAADFLLPLSRSWWWSNINISSAKSHRAGWTWLPFTPEAVRWVCRAAPFLQGSAWLSLLRSFWNTPTGTQPKKHGVTTATTATGLFPTGVFAKYAHESGYV